MTGLSRSQFVEQLALDRDVRGFGCAHHHIDRRLGRIGRGLACPLQRIAKRHVDSLAGPLLKRLDEALAIRLFPRAAERGARQIGAESGLRDRRAGKHEGARAKRP
ncbi:hypothetical protein [Burkholderia ubonensis]|uniref:hypothetical protein n=1 Tax=Burkholderia ubonensis TaxID=101571 RepID=UPI0012F98787|nr:hypothetical protein [Burkholderia ubonensis]